MPKFEVEIDFADFFGEDSRSEIFRLALVEAIKAKLNDNQWVQSNVAHYLFQNLKDEIFSGEIESIRETVKAGIEEHKKMSSWDIQHHKRFQDCIIDALNDMSDDIKAKAQETAKKLLLDESTTYDSFHGRVADACVSRVFDLFVHAMVEKENSK